VPLFIFWNLMMLPIANTPFVLRNNSTARPSEGSSEQSLGSSSDLKVEDAFQKISEGNPPLENSFEPFQNATLQDFKRTVGLTLQQKLVGQVDLPAIVDIMASLTGGVEWVDKEVQPKTSKGLIESRLKDPVSLAEKYCDKDLKASEALSKGNKQTARERRFFDRLLLPFFKTGLQARSRASEAELQEAIQIESLAKPVSLEGVKDLIAFRVTGKYGSRSTKILIQNIKNNILANPNSVLDLTEIKNYKAQNGRSYATKDELRDLWKAVKNSILPSEEVKVMDPDASFTAEKKSGYTGLHLIFRVRNTHPAVYVELQCRGREVNQIAVAEHLYYKAKETKDIGFYSSSAKQLDSFKARNAALKSAVELLHANKQQTQLYEEYLQACYRQARSLEEPDSKESKVYPSFTDYVTAGPDNAWHCFITGKHAVKKNLKSSHLNEISKTLSIGPLTEFAKELSAARKDFQEKHGRSGRLALGTTPVVIN
jgi:ppGpp synthetase/RelA/SpoT-type nucleotidyltranferase